MDKEFTNKLQTWLSLPREQRDWDEGALMLLQLTGNKIMYRNLSVNPEGKANFIEGKLQQYLEFRLAELTHEQVKEMQHAVEEIVKEQRVMTMRQRTSKLASELTMTRCPKKSRLSMSRTLIWCIVCVNFI